MAIYLYKSTTGRTFNVSTYSVTVGGLHTDSSIKALDALIGISLQRYTNNILDIKDGTSAATLTTGTRTLSIADDDTLIKCTGGAVLTIPTDAVGGFTDNHIIRSYQGSATAVTYAVAGTTLVGSPKTAAQYIVQTIQRLGPNAWVYIS
jgi:hypothetical protein